MYIEYLKNNRNGRRYYARKQKSQAKKHIIYVFMSTVLPVHSVTGTIHFTEGFAKRLKLAQEIVVACTNNENVAIDAGIIEIVNGNVKDYELSNTGNRPGLFNTMNQAIKDNLLAPFQKAANAKPVESISILHSGKFHVKDQAIHKENIFEGRAGVEKGTVDLKAPGGPQGKNHLHIWFSSLDNITFMMVGATNNATITLGGYKSGTIVFFRTQLSIQDKLQEMSQTIEVPVK